MRTVVVQKASAVTASQESTMAKSAAMLVVAPAEEADAAED